MAVLRRLGFLLPYGLAGVACLGLLFVVLQLWRADLRSPFQNSGDAIVSQLWVRNVLDHGWYTHSDRAAAPYGLTLHDFPSAEGLHFLLLKLLSLTSGKLYRVINTWYLLTYVLAAWGGVFALRGLGLRNLPAVVGGVLFAFLPFHFWRGEAHLFLSGYFLVPPTLLVAAWLLRGELHGRGRWLTAVVVMALVSSAGVYYAFFGCFFLLAAGLGGVCRQRRLVPLLAAGLLIGVTSAGLFLNVLPSLAYQRRHGPNTSVANRLAIEADIYALNLSQLVLPRSDHRVRVVREVKHRFTHLPGRPLANDHGNAVGTVGVAGLIAIGLAVLFGRRKGLLADLGALGVCGALLGTIGGFGSIFAYFVSAQIRAYDRVSIFLAFLALAGVAVLLDRALAAARSRRQVAVTATGCVALTLFGVWDQTSPADVPAYEQRSLERYAVARFAAAVEASLPRGAMIFQLPYAIFPESANVERMDCYEHFRLLLNTQTLRFSHGATRGRYNADVLSALARQPIECLVEQVARMGYSGIHVDRFGYADGGKEIEARIEALVGRAPTISDVGRDVFFPLLEYRDRLRAAVGEDAWEEEQHRACYPVTMSFGPRIDPEESGEGRYWRWCRAARE